MKVLILVNLKLVNKNETPDRLLKVEKLQCRKNKAIKNIPQFIYEAASFLHILLSTDKL